MIAGQVQTRSIHRATIRFAGDSGDGMQLAGMQFTDASAVFGNDVATLPDYPAEIRAPAGTVAGVSGFQINFADEDIHTPGDVVNALVAMNPAALKANIDAVEPGGIVVVNESEFNKVNLRKAGYSGDYNPLDDQAITDRYQLFKVPITKLTEEALKDTGMSAKDIGRSKNMFALGLVYWLYDRPLDTTVNYLNSYFGKKKNLPQVAEANIKVLTAGHAFGETAELFPVRYQVGKAKIQPGRYRRITGNEAAAMGLVAASKLSGKTLVYCTYPITPASDILHSLAAMKHFGVKTFQAEDEIAAICSAIGASFAGQLGVTGTSGPGLALKSEALGLAVMLELPLVVVNVQRGGPSTGLPTKTEQSDLLQAMYGRNGDCPAVVIAPRSPSDCFDMAIEASRIAMQHMVPVIMLSDGYIANGAEPWRLPDPTSFQKINVEHPPARDDEDPPFQPYQRNEQLVRPWAVPGTPGLQHRIGGLEKKDGQGNVCYIPENHQQMTNIRAEKVRKVADDLPPTAVDGPSEGEVLIVGWGGTYGAITTAVSKLREQGSEVSAIHLQYLNPLPNDLDSVLRSFNQVLVPELNSGQLRSILRANYLVDARGLNKVYGQPFLVEEIIEAAGRMLNGQWGDALSLQPSPDGLTAGPRGPIGAGAAVPT
jgi:2-oxoglutarate ferredoxin oxidoreductase subunit alpha